MEKLIKLKKGEEKRILSGHLWVFSNEIKEIQGNPQVGDIVNLYKYTGEFIGKGFYNPNSLIIFRLLTLHDEDIDFNFFKKKIENALGLRKKIFPNSNTYRVVNGESDFLPGLIIDKYDKHLVIQTYSYGMDCRLTLICNVLESLFNPNGIIQRDESQLRKLEGLTNKSKLLSGNYDKPIISLHEIDYQVDLIGGQKTGLFLDQRENHFVIRRYAKDTKVLDCFCNDGGFSLNAAIAGCKSVVAVDLSESAINRAKKNTEINKLNDKINFVIEDVFKFLKIKIDENEKFDLVILDPPSFTKTKKNVPTAKKGYIEINMGALMMINSGGFLATASCSHHIDDTTFLELINKSAYLANKIIRLLEWKSASPDHPILPSMPETKYLKFGIFEVS